MKTPAREAMEMIEKGHYVPAIILIIESYGLSSTQLSAVNEAIEKELTR